MPKFEYPLPKDSSDAERSVLLAGKPRQPATKGHAAMTTHTLPATILFLVTIFVTGCGEEPPSTAQQLIGTWKIRSTTEGKSTVTTFHADGTFDMTYKTGSWGILEPTTVFASGRWTVEGTTLKYTIDQSSYMNDTLSGQTMSETIMSINESTLVVREHYSDGEVSTWIRQQ